MKAILCILVTGFVITGLFLKTAPITQSAQRNVLQRNVLVVEFGTGGDDLRGGNDNVNLEVLLRAGTPIRFNNVNKGYRWINNSKHRGIWNLPANLKFEDIIGVRLETTFGGGIGGDNWNLNRLTASAYIGNKYRKLFDQSGNPLVRFTGNKRVQDFRFSSQPIPPVGPVMTNFDPKVNGFNFRNDFKNVIGIFDITTDGLCGGMSYAALDYFNAGIPIPKQNYQPTDGTKLHSYIYNRQINSIAINLDKWAELGFNPLGSRNREFFNWGLQAGSGRLGELRVRIDRGQPVPLGLWECGADCKCQGGCPFHHQVVAIGYEMGRYKGDLGTYKEDFTIYIYDPNHPGETHKLKPNVAGAYYYEVDNPNNRWRAYFVDTKYTAKMPPVIPDQLSELVVDFDTGNDDLRGGNDNVNLIVLLRAGTPIRFNNVNEGKRWIDSSTHKVGRPLPAHLEFEDIVGVRLETTFGGGIGGDNWNLNRLVVKVRRGKDGHILFDQRGNPLVRFTGNNRVHDFRFSSWPPSPPVVRIQFNTGGDDLR